MNTGTFAKPLVALAALAAIGAGAAGSMIASAQTNTGSQTQNAGMHMRGWGDGVAGTITSLSGNTMTVTGKNGTTYTVDISNAKILKASKGAAPSTASASSLAVGDTVGVRGTVTGTSVSATEVVDGIGAMGRGHHMGGKGMHGVQGTVSAVNGNTITITGNNGTTYTIDASKAQVGKVVTLSVSDIKVGDTIGVQGSVSGTSVTANHIMDGVPPFGSTPPQR